MTVAGACAGIAHVADSRGTDIHTYAYAQEYWQIVLEILVELFKADCQPGAHNQRALSNAV